jgi:hypothetical protein
MTTCDSSHAHSQSIPPYPVCLLAVPPGHTLEGVVRRWAAFMRRPEDAAHLLEGLRKAGLAER